jgi:hypothetical protein
MTDEHSSFSKSRAVRPLSDKETGSYLHIIKDLDQAIIPNQQEMAKILQG